MARETGMALKVAQKEGNPHCFELALAVVDCLLEDGTSSGEFANFCIDLLALLFLLPVADDFGIGLPVGEVIGGCYEGIEPSSRSREKLEEPCPHRVDRDA